MAGLIAVTGATGFAGGHAAALLKSRGYELRLLVRDTTKAPAGAEFVEGDLANEAALARLCQGARAVVHFAGAIAAPDRDTFFAINEAGTRALAQAAKQAGVRRFIHVSSLAAREPELSDYAASKLAGEAAVEPLDAAMSLAILRPPAVYGPGDRATLPLLKQLTQRIAFVPGRSDGRFSLIHVGDLARLAAELVDSTWTGLAEIDDGRVGGYGWDDLARIAGEAEARKVTPVLLPRLLLAGLARLGAVPGLTPGKVRELYHADWVARGEQPDIGTRTDFARGFRETVAWYRAEAWLPPARDADRRQRGSSGVTAL